LLQLEFPDDVSLPGHLAGRQLDAVQLALDAKGVNELSIAHRRAARAGIESIAVLIVRRVGELPETPACLGVQALDELLIAHSVEKHKALADNRWRSK